LGEDFAALFHLLHLVAHDDHNRAFAQAVDTGVLSRGFHGSSFDVGIV